MKSAHWAGVVLAIAGTAANAQGTIYVGIGAGNFYYDEGASDILLSDISSTVSTYRLFGGFEVNEHLALELNYAETDDIVHSASGNILQLGDVDYELVMDFRMQSYRAIGQIPREWGALLGGLGYFSVDNDFSELASTECCGVLRNSGSVRDDGTTAMLGVEWRFGQFGTRFAVRLEYEWWDISSGDSTALGVAFSYGF